MEKILKRYANKYTQSKADYFIGSFTFVKVKRGYDIYPTSQYVALLCNIGYPTNLLEIRSKVKLVKFIEGIV